MVFYSTGTGKLLYYVVSLAAQLSIYMHKSKAEQGSPAPPSYNGTSSIICNAPSLPTVIITSPSVFVENPASEYLK